MQRDHISGVHLVAHRPGQGVGGVGRVGGSLRTFLLACQMVHSPHHSHVKCPCSCPDVQSGTRLRSQPSCCIHCGHEKVTTLWGPQCSQC